MRLFSAVRWVLGSSGHCLGHQILGRSPEGSQDTLMNSDHPSREELLSFLNGKLDAAQANAVSAHFQHCKTCYEPYAKMAAAAMLAKMQEIQEQNEAWTCSDQFWGPPYPLAAMTPPRTEEEIRSWETEHKFRLPAELSRALSTQNGGYVGGTELVICPLQEFQLLSAPKWDDAFRFDQIVGERDKLLYIGFEGQMPASIVLNYAAAAEPSVLYLWHDLGGELRQEADSFDALLKSR
jgi:hypothetical protein